MSVPTIIPPTRSLARTIGVVTATSVGIANVIGSGIFTTPGFLARDLGSPFSLLAIWVLGAILAFAGALSYSELGAAYPRAGGEYVYLREAYGPLWGYLSGWSSFFSGFSAPIAAACIGFSAYLSYFFPAVSPENVLWSARLGTWQWSFTGAKLAALLALWMLSLVHILGVRGGGHLQVVLTSAKVLGIVSLIVFGLWLGTGDWSHFRSGPKGWIPPTAWRNAATSLIFVLYCFSGWNAAAYLAGEVRDPHRNLPLSLLAVTGIVTALYMGLNVVFLYGLPIEEMSGVLQVGEKAFHALFGPVATSLASAFMALSILASASAMILAGPRVYFAMAADGLFPTRLASVHARFGSPAAAILAQSFWTSLLLLTGTFEQLLIYSGFVVVLFSSLAVAALMVIRQRRPDLPRPFRVPLYPFPPLLFLAFSAWILLYTLRDEPVAALFGIGTVLLGLPFYALWRNRPFAETSR